MLECQDWSPIMFLFANSTTVFCDFFDDQNDIWHVLKTSILNTESKCPYMKYKYFQSVYMHMIWDIHLHSHVPHLDLLMWSCNYYYMIQPLSWTHLEISVVLNGDAKDG